MAYRPGYAPVKEDPSADSAGPQDAPPPKKRARGQNKGRTFAKTGDEVSLCTQFAQGSCRWGDECRFGHDLVAYLKHKPADIVFIAPQDGAVDDAWLDTVYEHALKSERTDEPTAVSSDAVQKSIRDTYCVYFAARGECPAGWRCRFLGAHVKRVSPSIEVDPDAQGVAGTGLELVRDEAKMAAWRSRPRACVNETHPENDEVNWLAPNAAKALRARKYRFEKAPLINRRLRAEAESGVPGIGPLAIDYAAEKETQKLAARAPKADATEEELEEYANALRNVRTSEASSGADDTARIRPAEKRRLHWKGELYLAPLTTTGNLPFRRLCASFGSEIHCGEMGLGESYLSGHASEWSLVRRWDGERIFGTQVCGSKPEVLVPVAEALAREVGSGLDFVDVNCGCPIDLVFNRGAGSALLDSGNRLGRIVRGMSAALGEIPLTIKLRTGTSTRTAHKLFAKAQTEWGVGAITLHGRSRRQRYKNDADWSYVRECADALRESVTEWNESHKGADTPELQPVPIYGNGDVFGWRDYYDHIDNDHVDGTMIARGALIKPWVFTEIKERRDWDISSRERLDIIRQYAQHGLAHWGADTQGVNTTRRFLCEMLSFTHRYVPLGILDHVPIRMNDRPPPFAGRDPLESLLSSPSSADWVRISEMFLGPAPEGWHFTLAYDALTDLSAPLRVPAAERTYARQFAHIYDYRLSVLRRRVLDAARKRYPELPYVERILDTVAGHHCFVVGTIYASMPNKPDVLKEISDNFSQAPATNPDSYADPERDELFIEDQSGRVKLVGDKIKAGSEFAKKCVTGVVIGVLGFETPQGDLHVEDIQLPGIPRKLESASGAPEGTPKIVLVSGLGLGNRSGDPRAEAAFDMLSSWIAGDLGGSSDKIGSVVVAGNSVPAATWHHEKKSTEPDYNPYDTADPQLARLAAGLDALVVLPGADDPASIAVPQQPLLRPLMPRAAAFSALQCVTNPAWFSLYGSTVLATSGQNIDDIVRYAVKGSCTPIEAARYSLEYAHVAPTAPDTLWSYPFKASDPFVLRAAPDLYIVGNQPEFATQLIEEPQRVRIVLVPRFDKTFQAVLVDPHTLDCEVISFNL
ncbi:tRNA-dihydrouridine(47) synthase [NAD(P)(+)] [Malassezia cuniculi]|uniref:tRNA-dihydrouridine(47) synthase [NAD(P)(+)] n=1 Tax=Malassezia cuniculi TaxID=948313 RepID=A0AAF0ET21_9BASI|nr:tRNA-dihydrouridine(47) synthase [NAD(P)(+)] [Malassezia cuniculi]